MSSMRAIFIDDEKSQPHIRDLPIPQPSNGQVLIEVEFARIGDNAKKQFPYVPGQEGVGKVILSGGGLIGWKLKGKRVSFITNHQFGSCGKYSIADVEDCLELQTNIPSQQGWFLIPLQVINMYKLSEGAKCIIQTGSTSELGLMVMRYFQLKGVQVINIANDVREGDILLKKGARLILNSQDKDFLDNLRRMANSYSATVYFDAFGGESVGQILSIMPNGSIVYTYAKNGDPFTVQTMDLLFQNKKIFGLQQILRPSNLIFQQLAFLEISKNLGKAFKSDLELYSLEEYSKIQNTNAMLKI